MSEKRLNNSIFIMHMATKNFMHKHNLSPAQFIELDKKYAILNYIAECPDIFDSMTRMEMIGELEEYVKDN